MRTKHPANKMPLSLSYEALPNTNTAVLIAHSQHAINKNIHEQTSKMRNLIADLLTNLRNHEMDCFRINILGLSLHTEDLMELVENKK